jgi:hypothetical protein
MRRFTVHTLAFCLIVLGLALPVFAADEKPAETAVAPAAVPAAPAAPAAPEKTADTMLTKLGNMISFYGFLRLDIAYDTSRTNYGNWAMWVNRNKSFTRTTAAGLENVDPGNDGEISINPRLTRFGFNFAGPDAKLIEAKLTGQLEFDFYGGDVNSGDWKAIPRWRQAWLALKWDWAMLKAGQMSDLMSPLYPKADANSGSWNMGNTGARRPALQLSFMPKLTDAGHRLYIEGAIARPGSIDGYDNDVTDTVNAGVKASTGFVGDGNSDGEDSGVPMIMWRLAFAGPSWNAKPFTIGASGHYERYQMRYTRWDSASLVFNKQSQSYVGYSINAELNLPIMEWWDLRGEFYWGENTADVFGGVFQGINKEASFDANGNFIGIKGVQSLGFWVDTTFRPVSFYALTLGFMADMPDESTLPSQTVAAIEATRYRNMAGYFVNEFTLGGGFTVGAEYMAMLTQYKNVVDTTAAELNPETYEAVNHRIHFFFMYNF